MFLIELTPNLDFWSRPHPASPPATRQVRSDPLTGGRRLPPPTKKFPAKKRRILGGRIGGGPTTITVTRRTTVICAIIIALSAIGMHDG